MIRLLPVDILDIGAVESYLHDMAARGYILTDILFFVYFKKGEPKKVTYRLEPIMKDEEAPSQAMQESYEQNGWHYICTARKYFYIFASYDVEPVEIHTEPRIQSYSFECLEKKWKTSGIVLIIALIVSIIAVVRLIVGLEYPILRYVSSPTILNTFAAFFVIICDSIVWIRQSIRFKKILNNLKEGVPIKHKVLYKKRYVDSILTVAFVFLCFTGFVSILYNADQNWSKSIEDCNEVLPTVSIFETESGKDCIIQDYVFDDDNSVNFNNYYSHEWTVLAPEILHIEQDGLVKDEMWEDGSGEYSPNISTDYYNLRFKFLRAAFVKDLIEYDSEMYKYKQITSEEILDTGFDYAYYVKEDETQYLYAYIDNKVVAVKYQGYGDLRQYIEQIADRVDNFKSVDKH